MKLGVHILAYNVSRFIGPVIENAGPHVDVIYIAYSPRAWGYNPSKRNNPNPTKREELLATRFAHKTVIIDGDWELEEEARNACLDRARMDGCDYLLVQDADEFYPEESWAANKAALAAATEYRAYKTPWYTFWKTPEYVVEMADGRITDFNISFAIPCKSEIRFSRKRRISAGGNLGVLPGICFHYSYLLTDEEMLEKISTWGHASEMFHLKGWYRYKWQGWTPETRNLNVVSPCDWPRAVKLTEPLPAFAAALYLPSRECQKGILHTLGEFLYDTVASLLSVARRVKRSSAGMLRRLQSSLKFSFGKAPC